LGSIPFSRAGPKTPRARGAAPPVYLVPRPCTPKQTQPAAGYYTGCAQHSTKWSCRWRSCANHNHNSGHRDWRRDALRNLPRDTGLHRCLVARGLTNAACEGGSAAGAPPAERRRVHQSGSSWLCEGVPVEYHLAAGENPIGACGEAKGILRLLKAPISKSNPHLLSAGLACLLFNGPAQGASHSALRQRMCARACAVAGAPICTTPACSPPPPDGGGVIECTFYTIALYTLLAGLVQ
jgi:hypothetical protein